MIFNELMNIVFDGFCSLLFVLWRKKIQWSLERYVICLSTVFIKHNGNRANFASSHELQTPIWKSLCCVTQHCTIDLHYKSPTQHLVNYEKLLHLLTSSSISLQIVVHGYAASGGGRGIERVDVSFDGGKTWVEAIRYQKSGIPYVADDTSSDKWAWVLFKAEADVSQTTEIVAKAVSNRHYVVT